MIHQKSPCSFNCCDKTTKHRVMHLFCVSVVYLRIPSLLWTWRHLIVRKLRCRNMLKLFKKQYCHATGNLPKAMSCSLSKSYKYQHAPGLLLSEATSRAWLTRQFKTKQTKQIYTSFLPYNIFFLSLWCRLALSGAQKSWGRGKGKEKSSFIFCQKILSNVISGYGLLKS